MKIWEIILFWAIITLIGCLVIGTPLFLLMYFLAGMPLVFSLYFSFGACIFGGIMCALTSKL